ncbi:TPA: hypothetical protein DCL30_01865 [Candidatus Peribacteria bacterium]|nr:MAG: hypothetical protein A3J91_03560 [Candidatus Peribacteria bacterium RIFOXYC2_FULL_58_10]OGJ85282.1 MAG: hypothetical protein A2529_02355 [Candidatus Peribacteria bacterium RIFOXYD2_FULL_58_15]HAI98273.1 hypothetical protein [Candidatus Peribacteria bacterium]HAS34444.1 hypothetical protein [Candidatus Peribacteria bacterium]
MRLKVLTILWVLSDALLFAGAYVLAYFLRVGFLLSTDFPFGKYLLATTIVTPVWLILLAMNRAYHPLRNQRTAANAATMLFVALVAVALFSLTYYFHYTKFFSRLLLALAFALSAAIPWLWHILYQEVLRSALRRDPPTYPTLIVGITRESRSLIETLQRRRNPLKPVAILDGRGSTEKEIAGIPVLGRLHKLEETLEKLHITHLIQGSDLEQSLNLLGACRRRGITYMLLPSVLGIVERDERVESLEGWPVTVVTPG